MKIFFMAVLAGMGVGIGSIASLSLGGGLAGAIIFGVGLYAVCTQGLWLFTGKIGYAVTDQSAGAKNLAITWVGNYVGALLTGLVVAITRINGLSEKAYDLVQVKLNDSYFSLLVLGIMCGILMYVAVDGYKKTNNPLILYVGVSAFIICGFEHCVADMVYFAIAKMFSLDIFIRVCIITLGNSLGGMIIPLINKLK